MHWTDLTLHLLYSVIGTLLIGLAAFLLAWLLWRVLRVKADRDHVVVLENKGNCRSLYYLEVKSPEPALRFSLLYNNIPLSPVYLPVEPDAPAAPGPLPAKSASVPAASGSETVSKTGQSASASAGKFASLLEQFGELLPGSLGSALKQRSSQVRSVQVKANRTARAPDRLRRKVSGFQQLGGKKASPSARSEAASPASDGSTGSSGAASSIESYFVQTPVVEPGQSLQLKLHVDSRRRRPPQGSFPYTLEALPLAVDFPDLEAKPFLQNGTVHFNRSASWRYILPILSIVCIALIAAAAVLFLYRFIWL